MSEFCICAAIQMPDGYVVRGHRHSDCLAVAGGLRRMVRLEPYESWPRYTNDQIRKAPQGFVTSQGRFVERKEAAQLQLTAGIASKDIEHPYFNGECYSEDLY